MCFWRPLPLAARSLQATFPAAGRLYNEKTGLLCKVKDADSLYEQLCRMADASFAERQAMGQAAHEKMVQEFDKQRVVTATVAAVFGPVKTATK